MKGGTGKYVIDKGHVRNGRRGFDHVDALGRDGERLPGHFWFGNVSTLVLLLDVTGDGEFDEFDIFEWANPNPFMPLMDYNNDECGPDCA